MTQDISRKKNPWFFGILIVAILFGSVMLSRYLMNSAPVAERKAPARVARLVSATPLERASERVKIAAYGEVEAAQDSIGHQGWLVGGTSWDERCPIGSALFPLLDSQWVNCAAWTSWAGWAD